MQIKVSEGKNSSFSNIFKTTESLDLALSVISKKTERRHTQTYKIQLKTSLLPHKKTNPKTFCIKPQRCHRKRNLRTETEKDIKKLQVKALKKKAHLQYCPCLFFPENSKINAEDLSFLIYPESLRWGKGGGGAEGNTVTTKSKREKKSNKPPKAGTHTHTRTIISLKNKDLLPKS